MTIYTILIIPFLLELLILILLVRYIKFINIHLTDLVLYFRDFYFDTKSNHNINNDLSDIVYALHQLYETIDNKDSLSDDVIKND